MVAITSGVFLDRVPTSAAAPHPLDLDIAAEQLTAPPGHSARVHLQKLGDLRVSTVADLHRLKSGVQATLALIEEAVEQHDGGPQFIGKNTEPGTEAKPRRLGVVHRARGKLVLADRGLGSQIQVATGHRGPGQTPGPDQSEQGLLGLDVKDVVNLGRVISRLGSGDQGLDGGHQGAETGEPHLTERPQPEGVEAGAVVERVEPATMRVAGPVLQLSQLAEHRCIRGGSERLLQLVQGGDLSLSQKASQVLGVVAHRSHYESITPLMA
jgi:hypothetical protein